MYLKLISLIADLGNLRRPAAEALLERVAGGFSVRLRHGRGTAVEGIIHASEHGAIRMRLNYNRSFRPQNSSLRAGSWTIPLRPDYTLSLWPAAIAEEVAEAAHKIVHVHFDAKYRVEFIEQFLRDEGRVADAQGTYATLVEPETEVASISGRQTS